MGEVKDKAQGVRFLRALWFTAPSLKDPKNSQIVSFSSLANVLLRSFPMRLEASISEGTGRKSRTGPIPIPTLAPFTAKATKGKPTPSQTPHHPTT